MTKKQTIYYAARIEAARKNRVFASRDRAASTIHVSVEALTDYENGITVPPCDVVAVMCSAYQLPDLRNAHVRNYCPLMREGIAEHSELGTAALGWVAMASEVNSTMQRFARIALNNRIDAGEQADAQRVRQKAVELTKLMQETITAIDTALGGKRK